ncbi:MULTISPECIES: methionine ABC transporter permease [unclassified Paenibacillus]|uniref:methionine ABC transporter permease n=1 Tax=unclassified Paenibacillus TaxID=185978 RepID=UPI001C102553|nr:MULTISPECIES: methionine ABC transporter permease [unclassified Paenibacillus]MBU5441466.1 ABC transporter permease [Paenibacillus sp. MSJ-34]CAH0118336.1 Methionine import system permease protein MetP [Paenibacillus sp. CECT 9249]
MTAALDFSIVNWPEMGKATLDTLRMLGASSLFSIMIGLPLGIVLFLTARSSSFWGKAVYAVLSFIVNILRSIPFIILIFAMIPITRSIVGTSIGVLGTIPPLVVGAAPFFARLVETSLREVDRGVLEAAQAMGASTFQIIMRVLMPEARPGLLAGITITVVTLVSYTAMSGMVGGGGLGDLAIRYGYHRYQSETMIVSIVLVVLLVQLLQMAGDRLVRHFTRK